MLFLLRSYFLEHGSVAGGDPRVKEEIQVEQGGVQES
jgi:hypothetical protein